MKQILHRRGIKLVCVQYPGRSIIPLKRLFDSTAGMVFVDNELPFKHALVQEKNDEYFWDNIYGDFGHFTEKGHRIVAENIAEAILNTSSW